MITIVSSAQVRYHVAFPFFLSFVRALSLSSRDATHEIESVVRIAKVAVQAVNRSSIVILAAAAKCYATNRGVGSAAVCDF